MASPEDSSSLLRHLDSPIIRVVVGEGPSAKDFFVHEALICHYSPFFRNAMKKEWKKSDERKITLPEDKPEVFLSYVKMLYVMDSLVQAGAAEWNSLEPSNQSRSWSYLHLCEVYVLAERLMDTVAKDRIYERLSRVANCLDLSSEAVRVIYSGTPTGDQMRDRLCSTYADPSNEGFYAEYFKNDSTTAEVPAEFLLGLTNDFFRRQSESEEANANKHKKAGKAHKVQDWDDSEGSVGL